MKKDEFNKLFDQTLVIIPARKNSKRLKNKNIKLFYGKPIFYWPIFFLKKIYKKKNIFISTDCEKITRLSEKIGIQVPFVRPRKLSSDYAKTLDVIRHTCSFLIKKHNKEFKYILVVYPTSLFLKYSIIKKAYKLLKKNVLTVFSAKRYNHPIERSFSIKNNKIKFFKSNKILSRTQDLKIRFHDAGQFYLLEAINLNKISGLLTENSLFVEYDDLVCDIDNNQNFKHAKKIFYKFSNK